MDCYKCEVRLALYLILLLCSRHFNVISRLMTLPNKKKKYHNIITKMYSNLRMVIIDKEICDCKNEYKFVPIV